MSAALAIDEGSPIVLAVPLASVPFGAHFGTHCSVCCSAVGTQRCARCPAVLCSRCRPFCESPDSSSGPSTLVHNAAECAAYVALEAVGGLRSGNASDAAGGGGGSVAATDGDNGSDDEDADDGDEDDVPQLPTLLRGVHLRASGLYRAELSDSTLLRVLLRIMAKCTANEAHARLGSKKEGPLEHHLADMPSAALARLRAVVAFAMRTLALPRASNDARRWAKVAGAIVCNSHGIVHQWRWGCAAPRLVESGGTAAAPLALGALAVGCGIYPGAASMLNHSCDPNCQSHWIAAPVDSPAAGSAAGSAARPAARRAGPGQALLTIRTTRAVRSGEALEISYVSELQPRASRRRALRETFFFDCACARCRDAERVRARALADEQLTALACARSSCHGVLAPLDLGAPIAKWACAACGKKRALGIESIEAATERLSAAQREATGSLGEGCALTTRAARGAAAVLLAALDGAAGVLHADHLLVFAAHVMLAGVYALLREHALASRHCTEALRRIDAARKGSGCDRLCSLATKTLKLKRFEAALCCVEEPRDAIDDAAIAGFVAHVLHAPADLATGRAGREWSAAEVHRIARAIAREVRSCR